jgi:hypothetical protein
VSLATDPLPTSLNAPQLLAADYTLDASVAHTVVSMPMRLALRATNTGKAVWLANAAGDKGSVRLEWRWFKGGREIPGTAGRQPLPYAIFPEQTYAFHASIDAPSEPGDYLLDLGLVSELVTWFSVQGSEPLRISVRVEERPAGGLSLGR